MVDSLWDRGLQTTQRTRRTRTEATEGDTSDRTHMSTGTLTHKQKAEPPFFLGDLCLSRVCPLPHVDATTETTRVPSLIQQD